MLTTSPTYHVDVDLRRLLEELALRVGEHKLQTRLELVADHVEAGHVLLALYRLAQVLEDVDRIARSLVQDPRQHADQVVVSATNGDVIITQMVTS